MDPITVALAEQIRCVAIRIQHDTSPEERRDLAALLNEIADALECPHCDFDN